jgi:hypothetical protein
MRILGLTLFLLLAGRLAAPSAASAQYHYLPDAIVVGGQIGVTSPSQGRIGGGPELGGLVELPVGIRHRFRGEVATAFWDYRGDDYELATPESLRRHRVSGSWLTTLSPISPADRLGSYAGWGGSAFVYRFDHRADSVAIGIHALFGVEYLLRTARSRWILGGEVQLHLLGEPTAPYGGDAMPMLGAHASVMLKYRLP